MCLEDFPSNTCDLPDHIRNCLKHSEESTHLVPQNHHVDMARAIRNEGFIPHFWTNYGHHGLLLFGCKTIKPFVSTYPHHDWFYTTRLLNGEYHETNAKCIRH